MPCLSHHLEWCNAYIEESIRCNKLWGHICIVTLFFNQFMPFISFSCLIAVSGTFFCFLSFMIPVLIFFLKFYFYIFYRIKYIHLNTITFTQIIISWILRNRLSDSHWRSGMENMLRQIGNLFYTLSQFYGFHLYYLVLSITLKFFFKNHWPRIFCNILCALNILWNFPVNFRSSRSNYNNTKFI